MSHHDSADLKNITTNFILQLGIPANLKGYYFVREAVVMSVCEPEMLDNISGKIYAAIAQNHDVTQTALKGRLRPQLKPLASEDAKKPLLMFLVSKRHLKLRLAKRRFRIKHILLG